MSITRRWTSDARVLVDVLVAVVVAVLAVVEVAQTSADELPGQRSADWLAYALVIAGSVSLAWRRRVPIVVFAIVAGALSAFWLRDHGATLAVLGLPAVYAVAAHEEHRTRAWWALIVGCSALMAIAGVSVLDEPEGFAYLKALSIAAFLAGAIAAGVVIRNRERIFVDTERRAAAAEADRLAAAERAAVTERSRIAREMHDVVAHGMSVVAVQAAAGREIVHVNPDKAADVFASIEKVGRESLAELRRMLGVLRDTTEHDASLTPQPGIADIASAVEQSSTTGIATELLVEGPQRAVAPGVELAAFRIVQEALTNVRKHAGPSASATVRIKYEPQALIVEVTDDGCGAATSLSQTGTGHGLIGMRERVEIYGGELTAGPRLGGGYAVRARLPIVTEEARTIERTP
ncbi:MAG TPA: sensor histidine kinase [Ilumatobacteraceae bacterium]|nr:sensor histidine kinase [Ilumatobacteraceae bacterium]